MSFISSLVNNFKEFYSEINGATLTGATDVIVVQQKDGTLKSSPFHVRFGKLGVLKAREKLVDVEVNGEPVDIMMKLDDSGVAFFIEEFASIPETPDALNLTEIDVLSGQVADIEMEDNRRQMPEHPTPTSSRKKSKKTRKGRVSAGELLSRRSLTEAFLSVESMSDFSEDMFDMDDINMLNHSHDNVEHILPDSVDQDIEMFLSEPIDEDGSSFERQVSCGGDSGFSEPKFNVTLEDTVLAFKDKENTNDMTNTSFVNINASLNEIHGFNQAPSVDISQSNPGQHDPLSTSNAFENCGFDHNSNESITTSTLPSDFSASLCADRIGSPITSEKFIAGQISQGQLPSCLGDPRLVFRMNGKYLTWSQAAPIIFPIIFYGKSLPADNFEKVLEEAVDVPTDTTEIKIERQASWFDWLPGTPRRPTTIPIQGRHRLDTETSTTSTQDSEYMFPSKNIRKSITLTSEQLSSLGLIAGKNDIQFSVTTAFQGTTKAHCSVYLWHHSDKVVISDIDGTITKSDILGQLLPAIGQDWAQVGVAQLFSKIKSNNYHIMYLTARAVGQASVTKDYLKSVKQANMKLPDGPLFLNPDSLIYAFKREVIDRNPEEFKINCMKEIQSLFQDRNPFFAGYGNRPNDALAYESVGIPKYRIFTINPDGVVQHKMTNTFNTTYNEQNQVVDFIFPPLDSCERNKELNTQDFSSFNYWKQEFSEILHHELL